MDDKLKPWGFELEEYIREGEPDKAARVDAWQTAIGLQAVDGLKPSRYLIETAQEHIKGDITIDEATQRIEGYYRERDRRTESELEAEEADVVSILPDSLQGYGRSIRFRKAIRVLPRYS